MLGASAFWFRANEAEPVGPAGAPMGLFVSGQTTTSISLHWTDGDPTAQTEIERDSVLIDTLAPSVEDKTDTGRTANTAYAYRVRHLKSGVYSGYNGPITAYTLPNAPSGLSAVAASGSSIDLSWTNSHSLLTRIYQDGVLITTEVAGSTGFTVTGLSAGVEYNFVVRHYNGTSMLESGDSNTATETTPTAIPAPSALVVNANGFEQNGLSWVNGDPTKQTEIYQNDILLDTVSAGVTTYNDPGKNPESSYTYKVRHKDGIFYSAYSSSVTKTYPNITGLSVSGNDAGDTFDFAGSITGDLPAGTTVRLLFSDTLGYLSADPLNTPTDTISGITGNPFSYNYDVSALYDVDAGGGSSPSTQCYFELMLGATVLERGQVPNTSINVNYTP